MQFASTATRTISSHASDFLSRDFESRAIPQLRAILAQDADNSPQIRGATPRTVCSGWHNVDSKAWKDDAHADNFDGEVGEVDATALGAPEPSGTFAHRADPNYFYARSEDPDALSSQTEEETTSLMQRGRGNPFLTAPTFPDAANTHPYLYLAGVPGAAAPAEFNGLPPKVSAVN